MPRVTINITHRPNIVAPLFTEAQMREIGDYALVAMKERVASGTDVFDQPAPPLTEKYRKRKAAKGKSQIRDIQLTGLTLGATKVLEADASHARIGVSGTVQYRKALFNQNIDPWFGLSGRDDDKVLNGVVRPLFNQNLNDLVK
jgi:hypothetical protein